MELTAIFALKNGHVEDVLLEYVLCYMMKIESVTAVIY